MKPTVFGSSGRTGQEIVHEALAAGHHVTAGVRDSSRLPVARENLDVVEIPVLDDPEVFPDAVAGTDAVLSQPSARAPASMPARRHPPPAPSAGPWNGQGGAG